MTIYAWVKEQGEGCDYTIACGEKLISLSAGDLDEARAEIGQMLRDDYGKKPEEIAKILLFQYVGKADPQDVMVDDDDDEIEDDETCNRRTMYEELKREFG